MACQQQSWATICCGAPPELNVRRLEKGYRFAQTADLRIVTKRCFLPDGSGMCADKRMGGSREIFIAVKALYSTSIIELRRLEAARL